MTSRRSFLRGVFSAGVAAAGAVAVAVVGAGTEAPYGINVHRAEEPPRYRFKCHYGAPAVWERGWGDEDEFLFRYV